MSKEVHLCSFVITSTKRFQPSMQENVCNEEKPNDVQK